MIGLLVALSPRTASSSRLSAGWLAGRSPPPHPHLPPRPGARPAAAPSCTRRTRATAARHAEQTARRSAEGESVERARGSTGTSGGEREGGGGCRDGAWRGVARRTCSTSQSSSSCSSRRRLRGACRPTRTSTPRVYSQETVRGADSARGEKAWCAHLPGHVRQAAAAAHVVLAAARAAGSRACRRAAALRRHLGRGCARLNVVLRARPMASVPTHGAPKRPGSVPRFGAWLARGESDAQRVSRRGLGPGTTSPQPPKVPVHIPPGRRPRPSSAPASPACAPAAWRGAQRRTASQPRFETPSTVTRRARAW